MKRPPCIRGLKEFRKGCPQKTWDGHDGCSAWIQDFVVVKGEREIRSACIDWWMKTYLRFNLSLLEGNQQASEGTRNMVAHLSLIASGKDVLSDLQRIAEKHLEDSKQKINQIEGKNQDGKRNT